MRIVVEGFGRLFRLVGFYRIFIYFFIILMLKPRPQLAASIFFEFTNYSMDLLVSQVSLCGHLHLSGLLVDHQCGFARTP